MVSSLPPGSYGGVLDTHIAPHRSLPSTWEPSPPLHHPEAQDCIFPNLDPQDSHEADLGMLRLLEEILHNLGWMSSSINCFINQAKQSKSSWQVQLVPTSSEHTFTRQFLLCASLRGPVVRSDTYLPTHHSLVSRYWKQMQWSNLPAKLMWDKVSRYDFAVFYTKINIVLPQKKIQCLPSTPGISWNFQVSRTAGNCDLSFSSNTSALGRAVPGNPPRIRSATLHALSSMINKLYVICIYGNSVMLYGMLYVML